MNLIIKVTIGDGNPTLLLWFYGNLPVAFPLSAGSIPPSSLPVFLLSRSYSALSSSRDFCPFLSLLFFTSGQRTLFSPIFLSVWFLKNVPVEKFPDNKEGWMTLPSYKTIPAGGQRERGEREGEGREKKGRERLIRESKEE